MIAPTPLLRPQLRPRLFVAAAALAWIAASSGRAALTSDAPVPDPTDPLPSEVVTIDPDIEVPDGFQLVEDDLVEFSTGPWTGAGTDSGLTGDAYELRVIADEAPVYEDAGAPVARQAPLGPAAALPPTLGPASFGGAAVVPEPGTALMIGLGLGGLALAGRRHRRRG